MFPKVNPKQSFPEMEEKIIAFWKENNTFQKSIEQRPEDKPYRFYDGPPFITGTPHYGSLLSSIVKDIVPRYHTMQGKRVERKWGWDCHGLPIEEKVQKKLGLKSNADIEKLGIEKFIQECYTYTKEVSAEWDWYIDHIGRWVDMDNAYKTMDQDYMESVLWVFKQMHEKGKVYKGRRVSLYSWKLSTPISNFEVAMDDSYEEVSDPAVTVMFPLTQSHKHVQEGDYILAWTTTPWTIPAHMSMALNKNLAYSRVKSTMHLKDGKLASIGDVHGLSEVKKDGSVVTHSSQEGYFIIATARVETVFKGREYEIVESFMGEDLIGLKYKAPFSFYQGTVDPEKNHKVLHADFITDTDGTGIGHQAPEFGEVDFQLAMKEGIHISTALDNAGCYTEEISDYEGMHYQDANDVISEKLKELGLLFKKESINHRVAMCPRSGTKLIYKAQDSWFINIQEMKDRLLAENEGINWQPNHLKHGQFLKSVESAPDWCISRTRYWGTPMPIWIGRDTEGNEVDMKVFGSKAEIETASGMTVTDLHRPFIDDIKWKQGDIEYTRLPEVLDVWMDSGSMPYAQMHYPFENKLAMESSYPADFIVEYIGQVRAWFYVMHVVGVALFDTRSFTNVITTGIVMGSDGRKMSKSYGNYPDPKGTISKYGADAIRFYMANSPLLNGGNMDFKEEGIVEVIKKVILPLWNTYSFFTTYANIDTFKPTGKYTRNNPLDVWIMSETHTLIADIETAMEKYEVTEATRPIVKFMDNLTNWYIRRSRKRFWKSENDGDKMEAYETLYEVLVTLSQVVAPFMPFVTEEIYKNLTGNESVHLSDFPIADKTLVNTSLNHEMALCQKIVTLGLAARANAKIRVRQPLLKLEMTQALSEYYIEIIKEELNVKEVVLFETMPQQICKPNGRTIGPKFGKDVKFIISEAKTGNFTVLVNGNIQVGDFVLEDGDFELVYQESEESEQTSSHIFLESGFGTVVGLDTTITQELKLEGYARDIVRHIQEARKEAGYQVDDRISVNIIIDDVEAILASYDIASETLSTLDYSLTSGDIEKEIELGDSVAKIILKK